MTKFTQGLINDRWALVMPDFRVSFHRDRPQWEKGRLDHMAERVQEGMHVIDVGSEHADFSAMYRSWGCAVSLIEPSRPYWPCARATFEANGFEPPIAYFVGFASDVTELREQRVGLDRWPRITLPVVADPGFAHLAQQADTIAQIRLDDFAEVGGGPLPDAVVIDVEGAELRVLQGMTDLLAERNLLVWVSVHPPTLAAWYDATPQDITDLMASFGYEETLLPSFGEGESFVHFARL